MKTLDSTFDVVSDMDYFIDSCKKTCPKYAKETFFYYLNDEGLECIESMIEVFGIEKAMDFCIMLINSSGDVIKKINSGMWTKD